MPAHPQSFIPAGLSSLCSPLPLPLIPWPPWPPCHCLQIGIKSQPAGASVQLSFFLGNKHSEALQQLVLVVPPSPAFAFELGPVPHSLYPKKQVGWRGGAGGRARWRLAGEWRRALS
jgi:hypothetical protein